MALRPDLKTCLMWDTEPPYIGTQRQSSYFRFDGEDWYLKIDLFQQKTMSKRNVGSCAYDGCVYLLPRDDQKIPEKRITISCHILAGKLVIQNAQQFFFLNSRTIALQYRISSQDYQNPSVSSERWKICCQISSEKPLSIQINDETILLSTGPLPTGSNVQSAAEILPDLQRLSDDFSRLLDKEILPDAKLACNGRTWSVHKSILAARSEVFAAMFTTSGMTESETSAVRIENLDANVMDSVLKYIYGGKLQNVSDQDVSSLYEAADMYALHGLREACSHRMAEQLSFDNCLMFLVASDARGDDQLNKAAVSFVVEHFAQIGKEVWAEFRKEHPLLAINVLERFAPSVKQ